MSITSTLSTNKHTPAVDLIQVITDTTLQCRKIAIRIPKLIFVGSAMNKVWLSNTIINNFTLALKVTDESIINVWDTKGRNSTLLRRLIKSIRQPKKISIILTSQARCQKLHRHLLLIIIVWMTNKVFFRRSLNFSPGRFLFNNLSFYRSTNRLHISK